MAIRSFRHKGLRDLFMSGTARGVRPDLLRRVEQRLSILDSARSVDDLRVQPWRLHSLRGQGRWAIDVNGPWRITFRWHADEPHEVDLEQYH
jgi:proteic killer suppression protein